MLYTKQNLKKEQLINYNNITSLLKSNYNASLDTKFIIHGFSDSCQNVWAKDMRLSLLKEVSNKNTYLFDIMSSKLFKSYSGSSLGISFCGFPI